MDEVPGYGDLPCHSFEHENPPEMLPIVEIKEEVMDVKDVLDQLPHLQNPIQFVPVLGIKEELPDVKDLRDQPTNFGNSTEFVPVLGIKEELHDVKDELIPVHYLEVSLAPNNDNIRPDDWSDEDPLSILEKQSGCDSADKASCNYKPSELTSLEVTKRELYCKVKTSNSEELYNSPLYIERNPTNSFTACSKIGIGTVHHFGVRRYICHDCGKMFTVRRTFVAHLRIHSGERKHKCKDCRKCFTERVNLVRHSLIHSGEKKHKCQDCGKCFTEHGNLVRHYLIHSGEKNHKCQECGKCFARRGDLVRHYLIHSGERK